MQTGESSGFRDGTLMTKAISKTERKDAPEIKKTPLDAEGREKATTGDGAKNLGSGLQGGGDIELYHKKESDYPADWPREKVVEPGEDRHYPPGSSRVVRVQE